MPGSLAPSLSARCLKCRRPQGRQMKVRILELEELLFHNHQIPSSTFSPLSAGISFNSVIGTPSRFVETRSPILRVEHSRHAVVHPHVNGSPHAAGRRFRGFGIHLQDLTRELRQDQIAPGDLFCSTTPFSGQPDRLVGAASITLFIFRVFTAPLTVPFFKPNAMASSVTRTAGFSVSSRKMASKYFSFAGLNRGPA